MMLTIRSKGVLQDDDALAVQTGAQVFVRKFRLRKSSRAYPSDPLDI